MRLPMPRSTSPDLTQIDHARGDRVAHAHDDPLMPVGQRADRARQQRGGHRWQRGHRDHAVTMGRQIARVTDDGGHVQRDAFQRRDEIAARLRQRDAPVVPVEQPDPERLFQLLDLHRQRRLRDVQRGRRAGKVAETRHGEKGFDVPQFSSHLIFGILPYK